MDKKSKQPTISEAVCLAVEVVQRLDRSGVAWEIVLSRPGRDGTFTKTWRNASGQLDADQAVDLVDWVAMSVTNALVAWHGIQEVLQT